MVAMSKGVKITGHVSFSMKKFIFGGHLTHSTYTGDGTGPGEVVLAPAALGDIVVIRLKEEDQWRVGSDAFLACTEKIERDQKAQKASKAFFSGEGWFPYTISGHGLLWISSFGAIVKKEVRPTLRTTPRLTDVCLSLNLEKSTTSTMATWWHGVRTTR